MAGVLFPTPGSAPLCWDRSLAGEGNVTSGLNFSRQGTALFGYMFSGHAIQRDRLHFARICISVAGRVIYQGKLHSAMVSIFVAGVLLIRADYVTPGLM